MRIPLGLRAAASNNLNSGKDLAISQDNIPRISVYPWTSGSGFGTKYSNPATLPTGNGSDVAFLP